MHVWVEQKSPLPVFPVLPVFSVLEVTAVFPVVRAFAVTPAFAVVPVEVDEHAESPPIVRAMSSTRPNRAAPVSGARIGAITLLGM
jgi:hypothetical protein